MWKSIRGFLSTENFKAGFAWLLLLLGAGLIIYGYYHTGTDETLVYEICINLGGILLASTLFSFLTTTTQFTSLFRQMLEDVVYSPGAIKKRNDIEFIWERVSISLFKSKFPQISQDFLDVIKSSYLPIKEISYYNDYRVVIEVEWKNKDIGTIILRTKVIFELHTEHDKKFSFESTSWTRLANGDNANNDAISHFVEYTVDKTKVTPSIKLTEKDNEDQKDVYYVTLSGKRKYNILQVLEKEININVDNFIAFRAKWLVSNMNIQIFYPDGMGVKFLCRGTTNNYELINNRPNYLEYQYKGLILRNQGYIFILSKKD